MMHFAIVEDLKIDQNHLIHLIQENLGKHGETVHFDCYESGEAFLEAFRPGLFNAVFMDIMLDRNGRNGIDTRWSFARAQNVSRSFSPHRNAIIRCRVTVPIRLIIS